MKKGFIVIALLCLISIIVVVYNFNNYYAKQREVINFNKTYLEYDKDEVKGLDVTSMMNLAINNNEKYSIEKNDKDEYIDDGEYSIKIFLIMKIDGKTYPMEAFEKNGMEEFAQYFGGVIFKCNEVTYHEKNGRIATMTFEALQE